MVWGIIIDTQDDGFDFSAANTVYSNAGVTYTGSTLQSLNIVVNNAAPVASDDVLWVAPSLMNVQGGTVDTMPAGTNRVTTLTAVAWGTNGISVDDNFAVVWFNTTTAPNGSAVAAGTKFGALTNPNFFVPADGATEAYGQFFVGTDPLKTQDFAFVPEPSSMLLGLLGAVGLLRRRR